MKIRPPALLCGLIVAIGIYINIWEPWKQQTIHPASPTPAVLAANPMPHIVDLRNIPTLLIFAENDRVVPPRTNALEAQRRLGEHCKVISYSGSNHVDPRIYQPDIVTNFLSKVPKNTPVVLLHGWGMKGTEWFRPRKEGLDHRSGLAVSQFGSALRKSFPCKADDFTGDAWGNDDAVRALEQFTAADKRVVLVGCSMGGSLMWRYAEAHPDKVVALIGLSPVCDLKAMCDTQLGSDIVRAYGG